MISIIICSRSSEPSFELKASIGDSIGTVHELIIIDNSSNSLSLLQAYAKAAAVAKYSILCFCHDDVLFLNHNWGEAILSILQDPSIGIIGLAGSTLQANSPGGWWSSGFGYRYIRHMDDANVLTSQKIPSDFITIPAISIDGAFFALTKFTWSQIISSALSCNYKFHGYDMELSLLCKAKGLKNLITNGIELIHKSKGSLGREWLSTSIELHQRWQNLLPLCTEYAGKSDYKMAQIRSWAHFFAIAIRSQYSVSAFAYFLKHQRLRSILIIVNPLFIKLVLWHLIKNKQ